LTTHRSIKGKNRKILSLLQKSLDVIPAKTGIQAFQGFLDPDFRRDDGFVEFRKRLLQAH
jgi:hypothetical protein